MNDTDVSVPDVMNLKTVCQALLGATHAVNTERLIGEADERLCVFPRAAEVSFHSAGGVLSSSSFPKVSPLPCADCAWTLSAGKSALKFRKIEADGLTSRHRRECMNAAVSTSSSRNQH